VCKQPPQFGVSFPASTLSLAASSQELLRLRAEIRRLESLIKKLQAELASEREYSAALESQLRTLSAAE
jgi:uncharacterized protein YlxW (UPF0749 family)